MTVWTHPRALLVAFALLACDNGRDAPAPSQAAPASNGGEPAPSPEASRAPPDTGTLPATARMLDGGTDHSPVVADAGRVWPSCEPIGAADDDAGVSPYDDECLFDERQGVFVNPERGDDARADGSRNRPFGSLAAAIATAVTRGRRVYACAGVYEGPLHIGSERAAGLQVYGGLSCETYLPASGATSIVRARGDGAALAIGDTDSILIERLEFENIGDEDREPGTTYVGALLLNATGVVLRDVVLRADDGEDGKSAVTEDTPAASGVAGVDGADACEAEPNAGAGPVSNPECTRGRTLGGKGGDGGNDDSNGGNGDWTTLVSSGGTGEGANGTAGWSCDPGSGVSGIIRNEPFVAGAGSGARGFGALVSGRFSGFSGQPGGDGNPGTGGAGGGGARAPSNCPDLATPSGAAGGSGGSGGCGGKGGGGGQAGGSSLAVVSINSQLRIEGGELSHGNGGRGGDGAGGQLGGGGAEGGQGGQGVRTSKDGCRGTQGNDGGHGGPGGGANGGHAIGILHLGTAPMLRDVVGEDAPHTGGEPGEGPAEFDQPQQQDLMRGTPGTNDFIRGL